MENLTQKQLIFFEKLKELYFKCALPSYEKISKTMGYKSKNSIKQYIEILKKENLIIKINSQLYINKNQFGANLISGYIRAGFASTVDEKIETKISLDNIFKINSPSTFIFKVSGDSMTDIGIYEGDYIIIKKTQNANIGDVVLGIIDGEFSLKVYKKDKQGPYLEPQNKNYPILRPKESLTIFGVVTGVARKLER